ncbi:MAG: AAA family ATPase, partial [Actinobacteria bacterium]|nr:AAA family ATPase [Actinomycetota bacterium]
DALSFALYAKTPRVKNKTKRLICSRTDAAHVKLVFEVDNEHYEVIRVIRNSGSSEHRFKELSSGEQLAGDTAVSERIEELLGLDFDAFCSSVLLAQGRFSQFLEAAPTKQMQILKGVFRVDQIDELRAAAKGKTAKLDLELSRVDGALTGIPADLPRLIDEEKAGLKDFDATLKRLAAALPKEKDLIKAAEGALAEKAAAEAEVAAANEASAALPKMSDLSELADDERSLTGDVKATEDAFVAATGGVSAARAALVALENDVGTVQSLTELKVNAEGRSVLAARLAGLVAERVEAEAAAEKLRVETADLVKLAEEAKAAHDDAVAALRDLERRHQAHALRTGLKAGEPCPVCEQTVATIPSGKAPGALTQAQKKESAAATAVEKERSKAAAAERSLLSAEAAVAGSIKRVEEETRSLADIDAALTRSLGAVDDPLEEVIRRSSALEEASAAVAAGIEVLEEARSARDAALNRKTVLGAR